MTAPIKIELEPDGPTILVAGEMLRRCKESQLFHRQRNLRHPLGIYNVSISRITARGKKLSDELFSYFKTFSTIGRDGQNGDREVAIESISERLELFIYALAEHVDDCETILDCFEPPKSTKHKKLRARFKDVVRPLKRDFSLLANAIKHNHQRVRLFECEFRHRTKQILLIGFFLERFSGDTLGPDPNFLGPDKRIASCVAFSWSSVIRIVLMSRALETTIKEIALLEDNPIHNWSDGYFRELAGSLGRLPIYMFDDENPFKETLVTLRHKSSEPSPEGILGSFYNQPDHNDLLGAGGYTFRYVADGVTRSFQMATPLKISFAQIGNSAVKA